MFTICQHLYTFGEEVYFTRVWEISGGVSDCEELVGEVNHTTECVTDLFWIVDFEWTIL